MTQQRSLTTSTKKPTPNLPIIDPCKDLLTMDQSRRHVSSRHFFLTTQGTEVQSIFSSWKPKFGHWLIVSLVHCSHIFIGFFATFPKVFTTRWGTEWGEGAQKMTTKKQLFQGWGSLRSLPLKNRTPKKDDSFWTHYISSSWILEHRKYLQLKESLGELCHEGHLPNPLSKGIRLVSCYPRNVREQLNNCTSTMMQSQKFGGKRCSTCLVTSVHEYDEISSFKHIFRM